MNATHRKKPRKYFISTTPFKPRMATLNPNRAMGIVLSENDISGYDIIFFIVMTPHRQNYCCREEWHENVRLWKPVGFCSMKSFQKNQWRILEQQRRTYIIYILQSLAVHYRNAVKWQWNITFKCFCFNTIP